MTSTARVHATLFCMMMVWGLNLSAVKVLTESLDVMLVASIRMVMATAVMSVVGWYLRPSGATEKSQLQWGYLIAAGFCLVYCQQIAFAEGLKRTSATNAALVMALGPCVSLLMERAAFGRVIRQPSGDGHCGRFAGCFRCGFEPPPCGSHWSRVGRCLDFLLGASVCPGWSVCPEDVPDSFSHEGDRGCASGRYRSVVWTRAAVRCKASTACSGNGAAPVGDGRVFGGVRNRTGCPCLVQRHIHNRSWKDRQLSVLGADFWSVFWGTFSV
jgi:hypothetical protein